MTMTNDDKLSLLKKWESVRRGLDGLDDTLKPIGYSAGCELFEAVWGAFDAYTDAVGALVDDQCDWLSWYLYDRSDSGEVRFGDEIFSVDNLADLLKVIERDNDGRTV